MGRIHSVDSIFGNGKSYYDDKGNLIGYSVDCVWGNGQNFYDASGRHIGYSVDNIWGNGQNLYSDEKGHAYPKILIARTRQADYQYEGILVTDVSTWLGR